MNYTLADYQRALDRFIEDLRPLGADVSGALLFGSLARGDVHPGKSDLLDAYLVLRSEVCLERERFIDTLQVLVEAAAHLRQTGLPTHPFFYCFEHERDFFHETHHVFYRSDETSRILFGGDLEPQAASRTECRGVRRTSFFQARQTAHQLSRYLHQESLSDSDRAEILQGLATVQKHVPRLTCLALESWADDLKEVQELKKALPELDTEVLNRIKSFRNGSAQDSDLKAWRNIIIETLSFVEQAHMMLVERMGNGLSVSARSGSNFSN